MTLAPTPGQTIGPFFGYALPYDAGSELVPPGGPEAIRLHGRVLDGADQPVPDALLELWQVGPDGVVSRETGSMRRDGFTSFLDFRFALHTTVPVLLGSTLAVDDVRDADAPGG